MNIKWEGQVYIRENMDKSLFKLMKESGCYNMFIGLESGSDLILKKMKKNFNTASASEFFVKCRENGLHFEISLILGYPGETLNTIDETMNFLKINSALIPKIAQINQYIYYKFSEVTENEYLIQKEVNKNIGITEHINRILEFAKSCNIKYTKAFINNLAVL